MNDYHAPDKLRALKQYYGYDSFRPGQEPIIDSILASRDVLAVMPTGAGKSICYQIPAVLLPGITLVISPLISLMKDQVSALNQNGIRAAYLNSSLTPRQYGMALTNARNGVYKIIYVAPERLMTDGFLEFASCVNISLLAVDEAHCVSQWGHDFRKSYTQIRDFVASLPARPIVAAFTATATEQVKSDVRSLLALNNPFEITTGFDRPNLYFGVVRVPDRIGWIREYLNRNPGKSGIIYAMTRKNVEKIYTKLSAEGYPVTMYHAGLSDEERSANQETFIRDVSPVMIATNAFGMGIDKPDVAFILHFNLPLSMEAYYQEAGRAGRDGGESECILLYTPADIMTAKFLIDNSTDEAEALSPEELAAEKKRKLVKLDQMIRYCDSTGCLRSYILRYFGENPPNRCDKCSTCSEDFENRDITDMVTAVYTAVDSTGERFGAAFIADFLHGDDNGRMLSGGYNELPGFASLHKLPKSDIRDIITRLIENGMLERSDGEYPVLKITPAFESFRVSGRRATMKVRAEQPKISRRRTKSDSTDAPVAGSDAALYEELRKFRREAADRKGVPAYCIFPDTTLRELARKRPKNMFEMMNVRGIGADKAEKYSTAVIGIIKSFENR
ncbi:MAG: DNA helicase RecQ [Clostridia bacterium]|nr:DNA helicase RecQ [Clostridia bacterium]